MNRTATFAKLFSFCVMLGFCLVMAPAGFAQVVLTVDDSNDDKPAVEYSLDDLDKLTQIKVLTTNEFVDGVKEFSGPLVRDVLGRIGVEGDRTARFIATNEYEVAVDVDDFLEYDVILATRMDGALLSRRTKGPIWLIYPISDNPELRDARVNAKLIWQLENIEVQ